MRLTLRAKLSAIVGVSSLAFVILIVAGSLITKNVEAQLATIQSRYLPMVELEPQLNHTFEQLRRGFQDAVAAHDPESLATIETIKSTFLDELAAAGDAVDPVKAAALRRALEDYCSAASNVSRRLMADETGEALVTSMDEMQRKQSRVTEDLKATTAFDRMDLRKAFVATSRAVRLGQELRFLVSLICLIVVILLSTWLGRGVLRSLGDLAAGFQRFGDGKFDQPISVSTRDELGTLAQQANEMATSLRRADKERTNAEMALKFSNRELEAFSYAVAHDLRAPLRGINGLSHALLEDCGETLQGEAKDYLTRIAAGAERMGELIDALLALSRVTRVGLQREQVNLSQVADVCVKQLRMSQPERVVDFVNEGEVLAYGDPPLLRAVLENLLGNVWKFTSGRAQGRIAFGAKEEEGVPVYYIEDNGAGFDMAYADKLFSPFQRLHSNKEFAGTGIGLATVQRIVHRHGGRIWAEGVVGRGATFRFTLARAGGGIVS